MAGHNQNNENQNGIANDGTEPEQNEEVVCEEYDLLDSRLDELNSALDYLEQKNDDIQDRLKELLQSNIDIRQQLQNENKMETSETKK